MSVATFFASISNAWEQLYSILFYSWPFILVVALFLLRKKWKKYPIEAIIIEKRGDNLIKTNDRIGKVEDKLTGMTSYKLAKSKETIPVLNYDFILHSKNVNTNFLEKIINLVRGNEGATFLFKYGSRQYKPVPVSQKNPGVKKKFVAVKDKAGNPVYVYQYQSFDPRWVLGVLDFDIIDWDNMNFMVQEQRASVERRAKKKDKLLHFIIPITIIAAAIIVSIFILKFSSDAGARLSVGGTATGGGGDGGGSKIVGGITDIFTPGE